MLAELPDDLLELVFVRVFEAGGARDALAFRLACRRIHAATRSLAVFRRVVASRGRRALRDCWLRLLHPANDIVAVRDRALVLARSPRLDVLSYGHYLLYRLIDRPRDGLSAAQCEGVEELCGVLVERGANVFADDSYALRVAHARGWALGDRL